MREIYVINALANKVVPAMRSPEDFIVVRSQNLYQSLACYTNISLFYIKSIEEWSGDHQGGLVFVNLFDACEQTYLQKIRPFLCQNGLLERTVLVDVGDKATIRFLLTDELAVLELHGSYLDNKPRIIPGYGFLPAISNVTPVAFRDKCGKFYFRGKLHGADRMAFLRSFKKCKIATYIIAQLPSDVDIIKTEDIIGSFDSISPKTIRPIDYYEELNQYRFCLAPFGHGHTYRFLEGMAMGCVTITNGLSRMRFSLNVFRPGYNYLDVGTNLENLDNVIECCRSLKSSEIIAKNGFDTYKHYFHSPGGLLPKTTFNSVIRQLNQLSNGFFQNFIC